jgi:hypothetical protein
VKDRTSENSPFRTGDPVTRCKYILVSSASASMPRKVTVPPVPAT